MILLNKRLNQNLQALYTSEKNIVKAEKNITTKTPLRNYGRVLGLNQRFRNPEKLSEGEETRVKQTRSSRFSHYRVMVNSQGVLSR